MASSTDGLDGEKDYAFYETLSEVLGVTTLHINKAINAEGMPLLGMSLKMASRALRCALEIYGDRVAEMQKEKT